MLKLAVNCSALAIALLIPVPRPPLAQAQIASNLMISSLIEFEFVAKPCHAMRQLQAEVVAMWAWHHHHTPLYCSPYCRPLLLIAAAVRGDITILLFISPDSAASRLYKFP